MGNTALHFAIMIQNLDMVKLLDSNGLDATIKNGHNQSSIEFAIVNESHEIAAYLMGQHKY